MTTHSAFSRLLATLLALAMFAAACGGGSDGGSASSDADVADDVEEAVEDTADDEPEPEPESEEVPEDEPEPEPADDDPEPEADEEPEAEPDDDLEPLTASFRGVTEDEIHVGISMLDFEALASFNLVTEGWGDQQGVYQAIIDDLNARGGIYGRSVVPYFEFYSPLGSTEAEAACTALTKDVETFVVIGGFLGPAEIANNCVVETNDTMMVGGQQTLERLATATAPWVDTAMARERRLGAFLDLLDTNGMLEGRAVAVIGALELEDVYDSADATLSAAGVEPVLSALNDVPQGDTVASDQRWQVLAENIRASGADTVLIIGSTQAALRGVFDNGLDVEMWVLESTGLDSLGSETTPEDADGAISITALTNEQQWTHPTMQPCRDTVMAAFPDVDFMIPEDHGEGDERWFRSIHLYCRNMAIFELIANAAGPNPTQDTWQAAVDGLGDFELPGVPFASGGKPDLSDTVQLVQFDASLSDIGVLVPISEPFDATP